MYILINQKSEICDNYLMSGMLFHIKCYKTFKLIVLFVRPLEIHEIPTGTGCYAAEYYRSQLGINEVE